MEKTSKTTPAHAEDAPGHVVDIRILLGVFAALMVLTAITVAVSYFDFGALNLAVAMGVATVKATLVALFFMHLRYDSVFNSIVFLIGVAFLGLFLSITMLDTLEYQGDVERYQESQE